MSKLLCLGVLAVVVGCRDISDDEAPLSGPPTPPAAQAKLDAGATYQPMDASALAHAGDGAVACAPIAVCSNGKSSVLYNVCLSGSANAAASAPACLVDANGALYLLPLASGQRVINPGWTMSTGAASAALSAQDLQRCADARAALAAAAPMSPPCANQ